VLGVYADRRGRKAALTLTILMMAFGTALLGFAPTYAQAGLVGPLVIVLARLIQGFSAGGEIGGATAFLIEYAPPQRRGFFASWQQTSQAIAVVLGGICGTVVTQTLDPAALDSWGWRVPFLFGLLIGPVGFYIRSHIDETPVFADSRTEKSGSPLRDALREHPRDIASGFGVTILWTVCTYVLLFYMTTYAVKQLGMSLADAFVASTIGGVVLMLGCPVAGMLSDRIGIMSARPGRFIDIVATGWPRDRDSRIVSDRHFGEVTARLWTRLREESLRAIGRDEMPASAAQQAHRP